MLPDAASPDAASPDGFFWNIIIIMYVQELVPICPGWGAPPLVSVQMVIFSVLVQMGEFSSRGS